MSIRERNPRRMSKRKRYDEVVEVEKKAFRSCDKSGCGESRPFCYLQSSDNCCRDGYTSRWYHMSLGEHFCNECFDHFYRPHKEGFKEYDAWYRTWYHNSKVRPSIKRFVADEVMPYWLKCTKLSCGKWREVRNSKITPEYIYAFNCEVLYKNLQKNPCDIEEEVCVGDISKPGWIEKLAEYPLLRESVAAPYLQQFCEESIGLSPFQNSITYSMPEHIKPFSEPMNGHSPIWLSPGEMMFKEENVLSSFLPWSSIFLSLRNLIIAAWNMSPQDVFTIKKLNMYVICRGLVRIYLLSLASEIIRLLTHKGVINYGIVGSFTQDLLLTIPKKVIVIGGGISGLAAAKHLHNLGIQTTVLEASSRIGGRISSSSDVGFGSLWINGLTNNPLTVMCHQIGSTINEIPSNPIFLKPSGEIVTTDTTERMILHFTGMLDGALENKEDKSSDQSWFDTLTQHQKDFHQLAKFSTEDDLIFDFMMKLTEIENRIDSRKITRKNYEFSKKLGNDGLITGGFIPLIDKLADGLDIQLNNTVEEVSYQYDNLKIMTNKGHFEASHVIIAVPLPILQKEMISFQPPLPANRIGNFKKLVNTMQENVVMQFKTRFWKSILKNGILKFAILSTENVFQYFVDITNSTDNKQPTLVTFVNDANRGEVGGSDNEIISACLEVLKKTFKKLNIAVPKPLCSSVSAWCEILTCGTSGSFVEVGSDYSLYDKLSQPVQDKVFFAGESTYRKCPNSMTGAYLSGLREAVNIVDKICPFEPHKFSLW